MSGPGLPFADCLDLRYLLQSFWARVTPLRVYGPALSLAECLAMSWALAVSGTVCRGTTVCNPKEVDIALVTHGRQQIKDTIQYKLFRKLSMKRSGTSL